MDFLVVSGFDVKPGKSRELQEWVRANAADLSANSPDGIELLGIYASMFSSDKQAGHYRTIWRLDSYGAMDRFSAAIPGNPKLARLLDELDSFTDSRLGAGSSSELLKSVADTTIWGDLQDEE